MAAMRRGTFGKLDVVVENCDAEGADKSDVTDGVIDDEEDYRTVTLRRQNGIDGKVVRVSDEDYKFMDLIEDSVLPKSSRRKVELGSEKMVSDADLLLAATLVSDAIEGRTVDIKTEPKYVRSYTVYKSWPCTYGLYLAIMMNQALVLFEKPTLPNLELSYWVTMLIETICLCYFVARTFHQKHWRRTTVFFRDLKNIFLIFLLAVTVIDMFVFIICDHVGLSSDMRNIRYSRVLRPLFLVNFSDGRQIRRAWRNIRRTIKEIVHVLMLFYFFIFVFALIAYLMFSPREDIVYPDGRPYFKEYIDCVWDLYVLVTTSNNPDVMMPAYDSNQLYSLFFFVYIVVCFYMLLNVFLAVAYHSYSSNMKEEIKKSSRDKRKKLGQAFDVIKINVNGEDMVTYTIWKRLMRLANPDLSKNQIDLLMLILDMNRSGCIGRREFMNVADLLNVPVSEVADRLTVFDSLIPDIYTSAPSELLKALVDSVYFKLLMDGVVLVYVFLIAFRVADVEPVFCTLFTLEILFKVYTFGPRKYSKRILNWFDMVLTIISVVAVATGELIRDSNVHIFIETILTVRIFRVLRLLVHVQKYKVITDTLLNISLSILMYGGIVFIIFYMFAIVGMELFQGRITYYGYTNITDPSRLYCGAPELKDSAFYESRYCSLNFNDFPSAIMVLSTLLFENNWHVVTEGFVLVTNKAARIFFAIFFLTAAVVIMNIITAFVVDMFMYEYTLQKEGKVDSPVEKKIKELGLGIDAETGMEISEPMTDEQLLELIRSGTIPTPNPGPSPNQPASNHRRRAETRFSRISQHLGNFGNLGLRKVSVPTLNRFDGIRFHIKKTGWTKIEVLLQQLYESETDSSDEPDPGDIERTRNRSLIV